MKDFRHLVFLCLFCAAAFSLHAQKLISQMDGYTLLVATDAEDAIYKVGQQAVFEITLLKDGLPADGQIKWYTTKDYFFPKKDGTIKVTGGKAQHTVTLGEPGFMHFRANFVTPAGNTLSQLAAAGFDPDKIAPSMPAPDDFDRYWAEQKRLQEAVPMNLKLTPVQSSYKDRVTAFEVEADALAGKFTGYIVMPAGAEPGSLPAMLRLEGAGVASAQLSVAAKWASEGLLVIDFNVNGIPNGQSKEFYEALNKGELREYYRKGNGNREELFFRAMILRLMRAIEIVTARPEWDGRNLIAFGRSQGGGQALIAGGLDSRVNLVCAEIPALCDHTGSMVGRISGWPRLVQLDKTGKPVDMKQIEAARYVDAMNFASRIKAPVYVTVGYIDLSCAPTSVYAMYNQIKGEKQMQIQQFSGHVTSREGDEFVGGAVREFLGKLNQ